MPSSSEDFPLRKRLRCSKEFALSELMRSRLPASTRNLRRRPSVRQGGGWRTTATVSALKAREASFFASSLRHVVDRKRMQAIPCTQARGPRSVAASALRQPYRAGCQALKVGELRRQPSTVHSTVGHARCIPKAGLTLPSRGRPTSGFASCRPPLMSNVRPLNSHPPISHR